MHGRLFEDRLAERLRQEFHDEIVGERRRAGEIESRPAKLPRHVGMPEEVPVFAQIFVDQIVPVARLQGVDPRFQGRHHLEHRGLGGREAVDQRNGFLGGGGTVRFASLFDAMGDMLEGHGA